MRNHILSALLGSTLLCLVSAAVPPQVAYAQATDGHQVPADFKGVVGLGLIGAELGMVIPALVGVDDTWAFIVFPAVGAIGGGVAGYFLLESGNHTDASVAMLGIGMTLVIPAAVLTLSLTAYDPEEEQPESAPTETAALSPQVRARRAQARAGVGLLRMAEGGVWLGAPAVAPVVSTSASGQQQARFGASDFQVALVSGAF